MAERACGCGGEHVCAPGGFAVQSLEEMTFDRGLWGAAVRGDRNKVQMLLRAGKDPNCVDGYGYTPLHYAARGGHLDICELLLAAGAVATVKTHHTHTTPLHRAAGQGHSHVVTLLLAHGADSSVKDCDRETAYDKATKAGHREVCVCLEQHHV